MRPTYVERHRELMAARSSGMGANPTYRDPWSRMETHWALLGETQAGLPLSQQEMMAYRDLAFLAASIAGRDLANEVIERSDGLRVARGTLRSLTSPNLEIRQRRSLDPDARGSVQVRANAAPSVAPGMYQAALNDPNCPLDQQGARHGRRPRPQAARPPPMVRFGFGTGLRSAATGDIDPTDDGTNPQAVAWSTWFEVRNLGVDAVRLNSDVLAYTFIDAPEDASPLNTGAWSLAARERIFDDWSASLNLRGRPGEIGVSRITPGLAWQFLPGNPAWFLQGTRALSLPAPGSAAQQEEVWMLRLAWTTRWHSPSAPGRWPLGMEADGQGPVWPDPLPTDTPEVAVRDPAGRRANGTRALIVAPAERYADERPIRRPRRPRQARLEDAEAEAGAEE